MSYTRDIKSRVFELAAEVARLICVEDAQYVDDKEAHRALDLAANELGYLLKLHEPEFENLWRGDDTPAPPDLSPAWVYLRRRDRHGSLIVGPVALDYFLTPPCRAVKLRWIGAWWR